MIFLYLHIIFIYITGYNLLIKDSRVTNKYNYEMRSDESNHNVALSSCIKPPPTCVPVRWKGDCGGKKQQWFPANYVEEISPSAAEPDRTVSITR